MKLKVKEIIIFIFILLLLIWISTRLFPMSPIKLTFEKEGNITYVAIDEASFKKPSRINLIRRIISAPFEMDYYKIVVGETSLIEKDSPCFLTMTFVLGENQIELSQNTSTFEMVKIDERYFWNHNATLHFKSPTMKLKRECEFKFYPRIYAEPYSEDIWALRIISILAFLGIILLFEGLLNLIGKICGK